MTILYTVRGTYNKTYTNDGMSWEKYIEWSGLSHLTELVSLDGMLNEVYETGFFTTPDFVLKKMVPADKFNLLAVVIEPVEDCKNLAIDGYEFVGYELLDQEFGNSALSNCGGFDETFSSTDLNNKGLIDDFRKAYDIKKRLLENNPEEHHANTNVIAIWRHKTIGR